MLQMKIIEINNTQNLALIILSVIFFTSFAQIPMAQTTIDDVSRLNETNIDSIRTPTTEEDIQDAVRDAIQSNKRISIAGRRHSQGGHIMVDGAIVLDMTNYNRILKIDENAKLLTVQSGTTWAQIQQFLNTRHLSVKVQQSSNIFTVGGSLSANIHGRDPRFGAIIETVHSFRLIMADGNITTVNRTENPALFSLVIGGYGLFGIITEVTLSVTDNNQLQKFTHIIKCADYPEFLQKSVLTDKTIELHYARPDIRKKTLLQDCSVSSLKKIANPIPKPEDLKPEKNIRLSKWLLNQSRKSNWGKNLRWRIQSSFLDKPGKVTTMSRNNAMRPPVKFLEYYNENDTDILQEYFIPPEHSTAFLRDMRNIILQEDINLLSITLRYVKATTESLLSYSPQNTIGVILYVNHNRDEASIKTVKQWTQKLIASAVSYDGMSWSR